MNTSKDIIMLQLRKMLSDLHFHANNCDHLPQQEESDNIRQESADLEQDDEGKNPADENRISSTELYVTDVIQHVRALVPTSGGVRDIIAGYSVNMGDLLSYMPYIWEQRDNEPYKYKDLSSDIEAFISTYGHFIRIEWIDEVGMHQKHSISLEGIEDLYTHLRHEFANDNITKSAIIKLSQYYKEIATRCLDHILKARDL
jgi:hypothetical protein